MAKYDSSPPPPRQKLTKEDAKAEILFLFSRSMRPLLIGTAALHLGSFWAIDKTEDLFQELVEEGKIRGLDLNEQKTHGLLHGYILVNRFRMPT